MNKFLSLTSLLLLLLFVPHDGSSQTKDYYSIPETLTFDGLQYKLCSSYHPQDNYYKQEYIPAGESADHFNKMITIDFVVADVAAKNMVAAKATELEERKKSDPVVHTELISNTKTDEYILDFILSEQQGGKVSVVERNVYRYKNYNDGAGHKGVLLFAISQRGYGDDITTFFGNLKSTRISDINKLAEYDIPNIVIK